MSLITRTADFMIPGWDKVSGKRATFEILLIAVAFASYSFVRNRFGSAAVSPAEAAANADQIIELEQTLGIYFEADLQQQFNGATTFLQFWNVFYGALHFMMVYLTLVFLFLRFPVKYKFWRRTLGVMSLIGLVGYTLYPLMPPRLLGSCGIYGACRTDSPFVDTLITAGGFWNFEDPALATVSNQFAAMPSLHIGWAIWVSVAVAPQLRKPWAKRIVRSYPWLMTFAVVITGNHFILDAVAGAIVMAVAYGICLVWQRFSDRRAATKFNAGENSQDPSSGESTKDLTPLAD